MSGLKSNLVPRLAEKLNLEVGTDHRVLAYSETNEICAVVVACQRPFWKGSHQVGRCKQPLKNFNVDSVVEERLNVGFSRDN